MIFSKEEIMEIAKNLYKVKYESIFPDDREVEKRVLNTIAEQISNTLKKNSKYKTGYDFIIDLSSEEGYDYVNDKYIIFDNKDNKYIDFIYICVNKIEDESKYISLLSDYIDLNDIMKNIVKDYLYYYKKDLKDLANIFDIDLVLDDFGYYIIEA